MPQGGGLVDRSKRPFPLVVGGTILLGIATVIVAAGAALGLVGLVPSETRIGNVQPIRTPAPATPLRTSTPPAGGGAQPATLPDTASPGTRSMDTMRTSSKSTSRGPRPTSTTTDPRVGSVGVVHDECVEDVA